MKNNALINGLYGKLAAKLLDRKTHYHTLRAILKSAGVSFAMTIVVDERGLIIGTGITHVLNEWLIMTWAFTATGDFISAHIT